MRLRRLLIGSLLLLLQPAASLACPSDGSVIGTSRVITIDAAEHPRIGLMQYGKTLPLRDKEIVLTFDDGPLPAHTSRVLDTLAAHCVKATFFLVGQQAKGSPEMVRRIYNEGHTIGTHTDTHPRQFAKLEPDAAKADIESGIAHISDALGDPRALAPFFRFPGLGRTAAAEEFLAAEKLSVWSADAPADDWKGISADEIVSRAVERMERRGKGVLLLHDIQPATVLALPKLLEELKARGFQIVHVVPSGERPKRLAPVLMAKRQPVRQPWPRVAMRGKLVLPAPVLPVPSVGTFGLDIPYLIPVRANRAWAALPEQPVAVRAEGGPGGGFEDRYAPVTLTSRPGVQIR